MSEVIHRLANRRSRGSPATHSDGMGIRYYAYPVPSSDIDAALANPEAFINADPLSDAWGLEPLGPNHYAMGVNPRPRMLYLDKCWSLIQNLTLSEDGPRPAYQLVAGHVPWSERGRRARYGALCNHELLLVADDLDDIVKNDMDDFCAMLSDDEAEYLRDYVAEARIFTRELAERGEGLAYVIG